MYGKVKSEKTLNNFISIPILRMVDIYTELYNIILYDEHGNIIKKCNQINISIEDTHVILENVTKLNMPIWCIPYHKFNFHIPYDKIKPHYYKIEIGCRHIKNKYRKMICSNFNNYQIKGGLLSCPKPSNEIIIDVTCNKK